MSLIGWHKDCECEPDFVHPDSSGKDRDAVHLDHYARHCPDPPFNRVLAEALYDDTLRGQIRYGDPDSISATALTSNPIQLWFEKYNDFIMPPLANKWMLRGTFAHEGLLNRARSPRFMIEQPMFYDFGEDYRLYGTMDCYDVVKKRIIDLKTQKTWAIDKKDKSTHEEILQDPWVKRNIFQINAYAFMARETLGLEINSGELQYWDGNLRVVEVEVPMVDHDKMREILHEKVTNIYDYLRMEEPSEVPTDPSYQDILSARWHPTKESGVWYLINEELSHRKEGL